MAPEKILNYPLFYHLVEKRRKKKGREGGRKRVKASKARNSGSAFCFLPTEIVLSPMVTSAEVHLTLSVTLTFASPTLLKQFHVRIKQRIFCDLLKGVTKIP